MTTAKGLDPRDFAMFAYGGAGPLHATSVARELGITRVIIPPMPGHFSAYGMLLTSLRRDYAYTHITRLAEADLLSRGWSILARNDRRRSVEFDLVARRGDELLFVEVKTRRSARAGWPEERVDGAKTTRMISGALEFMQERGLPEIDYRLAIASVVLPGADSPPRIEWFEPDLG